ncbi:MAG: acyltransferase domain-containing protein, partial [Pseudomonadales bacterium]|nr:acyltransferase domain-containing protein [Pseudomonadales bacterium]
LETAWHALENAGIKPVSLRGSDAGVFVGVSSNDYGRLQQGQACSVEAYAGTGNALSIAANRISYFLDLRGPSMAIDTACSSSLVAIHTACENLKRGGCNLALAAGVNLMITPDLHITFSQARMMAADGRCKTFSDEADGYVRGEGCGVLVLKRLSDAKKDGDRIYGVIRGSAVNQDGRSNGITAPNGLSQEQVIRKAVYAAGVSAKDIAYVEAHGTGTPLGDPIEVDALAKVYGDARAKDTPLLIGSAKTNIGHLESAAGVAGVIKTLLALHNEEIPGHLHCDSLSTRIPWAKTNTQVMTVKKAWNRGKTPRLAGVSAFGFGGTNSHVIIEEAPASDVRKETNDDNNVSEDLTHEKLLFLSAKNNTALTSLAKAHEGALTDDVAFGSYVQAVNTRRENFNTRAVVIASDVKGMRDQLGLLTADDFYQTTSKKPSVAFLFTGQGAQYWGMGKGLYDSSERFKKTLDKCASHLEGQLSVPLLDLLFLEKHADALNQTHYTQPALFSLEYALADLWLSLGVTPRAVIGHSVGEFAAACIAGVFSLEDALTLIVNRGALMQKLDRSGGMLVVQADREFTETLIEGCEQSVSIGVINGEKQIVLSGDTDVLERIKEQLDTDKIKATVLPVSHGFHSPLMKPMVDQFYKIAQSITYNQPKYDVISNIYGHIANDKIATPEYWRDHVTATVQFASGAAELLKADCNTFIEIGPKPVLIGLTKQLLKSDTSTGTRWIYSLKNNTDDQKVMLEAIGELYIAGYDVDVNNLFSKEFVTWADTPVYPFNRSSHWIEFEEEAVIQTASGAQRGKQSRFTSGEIHSLLGHRIHSPLLNVGEVLYESFLSINSLAALEQQSATNDAVFPPTVFFEMALEAGLDLMGTDHLVLDRVDVKAPLKLNERSERRLQFVVKPETEESFNFSIYSEEPESENCNESWIKHVDGRVVKSESKEMLGMEKYELHCLETVRLRLDENLVHKIIKEEYFSIARELGFASKFQALEKLWVGKGEALGQIQIDDNWHADDHVLHPALIDAGIQILWAANAEINYDFMYSPSGMKRLWMAGKEKITYSEPIWIHAEIHREENNDLELSADLRVMSQKGELIVVFKSIVLKKVEKVTGLLHKLHGVDYPNGVELLTQHLRGLLAVGLKYPIEEVNVRLPLVDIGMDSLIAMELLNDIESLLGVEINIMKLMEGINTIQLAEEILNALPPAFDDVNSNK